MKLLSLNRETNRFVIMYMDCDDVREIIASGDLDEIDLLRQPEYKWLLPVAIEDNCIPRRPEPEEHIVDLALRMLDETQFDYNQFHQPAMMLCIHGEAV